MPVSIIIVNKHPGAAGELTPREKIHPVAKPTAPLKYIRFSRPLYVYCMVKHADFVHELYSLLLCTCLEYRTSIIIKQQRDLPAHCVSISIYLLSKYYLNSKINYKNIFTKTDDNIERIY